MQIKMSTCNSAGGYFEPNCNTDITNFSDNNNDC